MSRDNDDGDDDIILCLDSLVFFGKIKYKYLHGQCKS